jgi:hypothetical protein
MTTTNPPEQITVADLTLIIGDQQILIISLKSEIIRLRRQLQANDPPALKEVGGKA